MVRYRLFLGASCTGAVWLSQLLTFIMLILGYLFHFFNFRRSVELACSLNQNSFNLLSIPFLWSRVCSSLHAFYSLYTCSIV
jgi:hypothetical protein